MSEEKKVWVYRCAADSDLEKVLNGLADDGYHVFHLSRSEAGMWWNIVAFNQVEFAKKLATDQVLQAIQQAGADALKNATAQEKKE